MVENCNIRLKGPHAPTGHRLATPAVNDKWVTDEELAEQRWHNLEMEKKTGGNLKEHIKNFVQVTQMENEAIKVVKKFLKNISDVIEVKPDKEGNGLYLNPYRR